MNIYQLVKLSKLKFSSYDEESSLYRLGMKQLVPDKWLDLCQQYPVGCVAVGTIINIIEEHGLYIEIVDGYKGTLPFSDIPWNISRSEKSARFRFGDEVKVLVKEIDSEMRRAYFDIYE